MTHLGVRDAAVAAGGAGVGAGRRRAAGLDVHPADAAAGVGGIRAGSCRTHLQVVSNLHQLLSTTTGIVLTASISVDESFIVTIAYGGSSEAVGCPVCMCSHETDCL